MALKSSNPGATRELFWPATADTHLKYVRYMLYLYYMGFLEYFAGHGHTSNSGNDTPTCAHLKDRLRSIKTWTSRTQDGKSTSCSERRATAKASLFPLNIKRTKRRGSDVGGA